MKVAIYARVSTDTQEAENQLVQLREFADKSNWNIYREYVDIISGKQKSREGFDLMFSHARKKLFDLILFWDISRFSRSGTLYTLQKLKELENLNIDWVSYNEPYLRTIGDFRDVVISIMATLSKLEVDKISLRTKAGLRRAKNVGKRGRDKKKRIRRYSKKPS